MSISWKDWRRWTVASLAFSGLFFCLGFIYRYHVPRVKTWLLVEIESQSRKHTPFRVWPKNLSLRFFPPQVILEDVRVVPQDSLSESIAPSLIKAVKIKINWLALFRGQFRMAEIAVEQPHIDFNLSKLLFELKTRDSSTNGDKPLDFQFSRLYQIPIDKISLSHLELKAHSSEEKIEIHLYDSSFTITNMFDAFFVQINLPRVKLSKDKLPPFEFGFESRFLLDEENLQVSSFKMRKNSSYLVASGFLQGNFLNGQMLSGKMNSRTHFSLDELRLLAQDYLEKTTLPEAKGAVDLDLELKWRANRLPEIKVQTRGKNIDLSHFIVGDLEGDGLVTKDKILVKKLDIKNTAGHVRLTDLSVEPRDKWKFSSEVEVKNLELRQLLLNLTVPDTPLHLDLGGQLGCQGELIPIQLSCKGKVNGQNLRVHSGEPDKSNIVQIEKIFADGEVQIDKDKVTYKSQLKVGASSLGSSSGLVDFEKGFKIEYQGDHVDFKDITQLSQLKLEGSARVRGSTEGDSSFGKIKMHIETEDLWLDDYGLGKAEAEFQYKEGHLYFTDLKGLFQTSRYTGSVGIDLRQNQIGIVGKVPFVDLADLKQIFSRHYLLPLEVNGTGSAEVSVSGPLVLNKLNFNLSSSFFRGSIANESFDEIIVNARAKDGNVELGKTYLAKTSSRVTAKGKLSSSGQIDLLVDGNNLRLEQSENIEKLNLNISGLLDFTSSLQGDLLKPKTEMHGRLTQLVVADEIYDDSEFKFKVAAQTIQGGGNLMGDLIRAEFVFPLVEEAPFRLFIETKNINFTQLFTVFSGYSGKSDFNARLSSSLDLRAPKGGFFKSSGYAKITDLNLERGTVSMTAPEPIYLRFQQGVVNSDEFSLQGPSTLLSFLVKDSSKDNIDIKVNGKLDMSLALLLAPFLDDLRGTLSLSGQLKGNWENPDLLGSAFVDRGMIRLKEFPQAFNQIRADLLFSHKNIVINSASGELGGGPFTADGRIQIKSFNNVPIDAKGRFKDVSLNFPEGVNTKGSGEFSLKGEWFPYVLGGEYRVQSGEVTKEVEANGQKNNRIKPSSFLPSFLIEEKFQPIVLDWNILLLRPLTVRNSLVNSPVSGSLKISGDVSEPNLKGQLILEKDGKVFFHETPFDVSVGRIDFAGENSDNPNIYLTANTRVKDQYDISLLIQGKARDPQINLSSQPNLSEPEIISLLALGIDPRSSTSGESESAQNDEAKRLTTTQTTLQIGSALLQKPLGDINKLTGVEVDVSGATGSDRSIVPNLTLKKQWSPKLGISASRTVENSPTSNAKVEYKFNKRLSIIGTWENKEGNPEIKDTTKEKVGVDLEYRVEFK